jgi:oligosaccharide repeat unit polymerase
LELIKDFCIIGLLPFLYLIKKGINRQPLNVFDLLIVFHTLNFCVTPLLSDNAELTKTLIMCSDNVTVKFFSFYLAFIFLIFITDIIWTKRHEYTYSLINLSGIYEEVINLVPKSKLLYFIILLFAITDFVFFMPKFAVLFTMHTNYNEISNLSYLQTSLIKVANTLHTVVFAIAILLVIKPDKEKSKTKILLVISIFLFCIISFYVGRRYLLKFLILFVFIYYSVNRQKITNFTLINFVVFLVSFYLLVFPFYNIIRNSKEINPSDPLSSVINTYNFGVNNYNNRYNKSLNDTESRSLSLFGCLYDYIKVNPPTQDGVITIAALDQAIPKVFNPNKGYGTDPYIQRLSGKYKDLSNSYLLHSYSDFHSLGFILAYILYFLSIFFHIISAKIFNFFFQHFSIILIYSISLFNLAFDVENKFEGVMSSIFQLPVSIILVLSIFIIMKFKVN